MEEGVQRKASYREKKKSMEIGEAEEIEIKRAEH